MTQEMSEELDAEGKLVSMILEANKFVRFACVCDANGKMLWNCCRTDKDNIMSTGETRDSLKFSLDNWKNREKLYPKLGRGRFVLVEYEKLTRITVPLRNNHLLYVHVDPGKPEYLGDILKIADWVDKNLKLP